MKAILLLKQRHAIGPNTFAEMCVWQVPEPVRGSTHFFKYRLAFVVDGRCMLRYDNEQGKGDHRHLGETETHYGFSSPAQLVADFWSDVDLWRSI